MKNKKWKLTIIALCYLFVLSFFFCIFMLKQLKANPKGFQISNWVGLWLAVFGGLFSVLGTFGVANSYDKKTMTNALPPEKINQGDEK